MSRQTVALHTPGKAAADSPHAALPPGTIRQMRERLAVRDGRTAPSYAKGVSCVSATLIEVIASLPEEFTSDDLRQDARLEAINTNRLRQQTCLLKRAGQLSLVKRGGRGYPSTYRRQASFHTAHTTGGRPLTDLEIRYRALRAEIKTPACTVADTLQHPND